MGRSLPATSRGSTAPERFVEYVVCEVCGADVPLTPVAKQVKKHLDPSSGQTCPGSGRRPVGAPVSSSRPRSSGPRRPRGWKGWLKRGGLAFGVLSALATILGVATDLGLHIDVLDPSDGAGPLRAMSGTYNIAVADFAATGDDREDIVGEAQSLAGGISAELDVTICADRPGDYDVECRGPRGVPLVDGDDAGERADQAAEAASELEADVLVYGSVSRERGQVSAQPAIYIAARRLPQLEELAGAHELVSTAGYIGTGEERRHTVESLQQRITNLTNVMVTLDKYNLSEADEARAFLDELTADEDWEFDRYLLELITGNVWGKLGNWNVAIEHYDESLRLHREATGEIYSRASLGKAEAAYHLLRVAAGEQVDCAPTDPQRRATLVRGLEATAGQFAAGREAAEAENADVIVRKADYGTGRVQACLAQAGETRHWARAERTFSELVRTLDGLGQSEEGLTPAEEQMLADSHSFLGFVNWQRTDGPVTTDRLQ